MTNTTDRRDGLGQNSGKKERKQRKGGQVIHVAFGNGGGRVPSDPHASARGNAPNAPAPPGSAEPVSDVFTRREVAKLLGVSEARLRSLDRASVVSPSGARGGRRAYTFQDLIALRATRELLAQKLKLGDVARAIGALKRTLPRVTRP